MSKKRKQKRKTEEHTLYVKTGQRIGVFANNEKIGELKPVEILRIKLDKN